MNPNKGKPPGTPLPQWRHRKTGGVYDLIGVANLQTETPLEDMAHVMVYRGLDGRTWVRDEAEFFDRFDALPVQAAEQPVPTDAQPTSAEWAPGQPITEEMHIAAVKVLQRAHGVDGLPQRMLDAMLATAPERASTTFCWATRLCVSPS